MTTVTQEYIEGIHEGRSLLKSNPDFNKADIQRMIENLTMLINQGFGKPVADVFKGERDFWKSQAAK